MQASPSKRLFDVPALAYSLCTVALEQDANGYIPSEAGSTNQNTPRSVQHPFRRPASWASTCILDVARMEYTTMGNPA